MPRKPDDKSSAYLSKEEFNTLNESFRYLLGMKYPDELNVMKRDAKFYKRVCELTSYQDKTVRNWYLPSGTPKISEFNLRHLCEQFLDIYTRLENKGLNKKSSHYLAFKKWQASICKRMKWESSFDSIEAKQVAGDTVEKTDHENASLKDLYLFSLGHAKYLQPVRSLVIQFYTYRKKLELKAAWEMLSPMGRVNQNWMGQYEYFRRDETFRTIISFEILGFFPIGNGLFVCQLYLKRQNVRAVTEFDFLDNLTLDKMDQLDDKLKEMQDRAKKNGISSNTLLKDIKLADLVYHRRGKIFALKYRGDAASALLEMRDFSRSQSGDDFEICICKYDGVKWFIQAVIDTVHENPELYEIKEFDIKDIIDESDDPFMKLNNDIANGKYFKGNGIEETESDDQQD